MSITSNESLMVEDTSLDGVAPEKANSSGEKPQKPKRLNWTLITFLLMFALIACCGLLIAGTLHKVATSASNSYEDEKNKTEKETYDLIYNYFYDWSERENHSSDTIMVNVVEVEQISKLEVLTVSDVEYITQTGDSSNKNITAWLEVLGHGVFTVNLKQAEYIVDPVRETVIVRLANPELSCSVDDYIIRKTANDWKNDSILDGETLALQQRIEGENAIQNEIGANAEYYSNAKKSAKSLVTNLIRKLNPSRPNLTVEVEFYE